MRHAVRSAELEAALKARVRATESGGLYTMKCYRTQKFGVHTRIECTSARIGDERTLLNSPLDDGVFGVMTSMGKW